MSVEELNANAIEMRILLVMISRITTSDLERRLAAHGFGSALQHTVLRLLSQHEYTISELGRKLMLEPATLVPVVDALERDQLVHRGHDPKDRRRTPLSLTEKGIVMLSQVPVVDVDDDLAQCLQQMGTDKTHDLLSLLREVAAHITRDEQTVRDVSATVRQHFVDARPHERQEDNDIHHTLSNTKEV